MARQMKDSGIEWIGEIPETWEAIKAKYLAHINHGTDPTTEGDIPVYGSGAESFKTCGEYKEGPTVLIGRKGATLHIPHYVEGRYWNVDTAFDVKVNNKYVLRMYYYAATCFDYKYYMSQTTLPGMTQTNYNNMSLPCPPLAEQQRIAAFLDRKCAEIDAVIERTKATIEEYKKLKQAVITEAVTKGVRGPRPMKDSGIEWIGEIPEGWNISSIKYGVTKVGSGKTPLGGAESYADEGILFLRSQNVYDTGLVLDSPTYITDEVDAEMSNTRVQPGDVLLNITGASIGRCCVFPVECQRANVNQHVCIIRVIRDTFMPEFMHYYWVSALGHTVIDLYQTGGNREGMSADAIKNAPIIYMSLEEQAEISAYLDEKCASLDTLIAKKTALLTELETYKKSLIYEYVTGKKEVTA